MAVSKAFLDMLIEMLAPLGTVTSRRMFGAAAIYCDGLVFALVNDDELFFKADTFTRQRFADEGQNPFTYEGKSGTISLPYWQAPVRLFEEPDEMLTFARDALAAKMG